MSAAENEVINFRRMTEEDLDEVLNIEFEAHISPWTRSIFEDCLRVGYYCPMIVKDNEVVAYAVMSIAAGEAHIFNVCVSKQHQRQGFGRQMVLHLLECVKLNKATTVFLEVRPSNNIAIALYETLGFLEVGQRKDYYPTADGKREDALIMAMELEKYPD